MLGDEACVIKLISPSQAESGLVGRTPVIADLIVKPQGKPTLAPDADPRPAIGAVLMTLMRND